jgi:diaminobutyrate-2-oxoglutarate transaminase
MSVVLIRRPLDIWEPGAHSGTFRANQLALVAATAALSYWEDPSFHQAKTEVEQYLVPELARRLGAISSAIDVRGVGALAGVDLGGCGGTRLATTVAKRCFSRGLIVERCGRHHDVIKVMPPLTIAMDELRRGCDLLVSSVADCLRSSLV